MKKVVLFVLLLVASSGAFAAQAFFTGDSHNAPNVSGQMGYACEYQAPNGNRFWLWFQYYCPSMVNI